MQYLITIKADNSPELLERLLRVCRHRGFSIQNINGETSEDNKTLSLALTICSERPISLLSKQLEKIYGVIQVATIGQEQTIKASA
jgi:acetolactate synthase II small subunit